MPTIGPIGNTIYANQLMHLQASKQIDFQNRVDLQNSAALSAANEKEEEVVEVRPTEETYKIDPEKEHQKEKNEEESGAKEEEIKQTKKEHAEEDENDDTSSGGLLDVKA
ncbi:MAG: hypothetical protein PHN38_06380 [Sulfurospirillaceae bacterium]|nr:hypothetical protein [Sulfurospirillaceae bacterium]